MAQGLRVGFPIDYRYGWDVNQRTHQELLELCVKIFQPKIIFFAPNASAWNEGSGKRNPEELAPLRDKDEELHLWLVESRGWLYNRSS